jgi:two-component system chemotaxis response regulator CheY
MNQRRVLVVDDSPIVAMKLSNLLGELGYEVVGTAKTGSQAVTLYEELKPDLVTMDITMPDMDGIEATRRILAQDPRALIIMVTSHGQEEMVMNAIDAGAKGYVLKPFHKEKLAEHIQQLILHYGPKA